MDADAEDTVKKTREAAEQSKALDKVTDHVRVADNFIARVCVYILRMLLTLHLCTRL
jgi:hypothetical protein